MEGRVSSVQSMGAVDGPGLRYVVFLQGCPLRCAYCHNPETWDLTGGTPYTAEDLCKTILRYRPYFGENGGVTVSGGEPLLQPEFVAELFRRLYQGSRQSDRWPNACPKVGGVVREFRRTHCLAWTWRSFSGGSGCPTSSGSCHSEFRNSGVFRVFPRGRRGIPWLSSSAEWLSVCQ